MSVLSRNRSERTYAICCFGILLSLSRCFIVGELLSPLKTDYYVSFIMTGRVDDLRGDSVGRLYNSIEFLQYLCDLHNVSAEVLIVEWNPFPSQPKLEDILRPAVDPKSSTPVRILTVPPEFHASVEADTGQSFFEFLAKNSGARRARGEFILITNGDVVLNDDVFRALSHRKLDRDAYFRVPRVELGLSFDPERPFEERLHQMRSMIAGLSKQPICEMGERYCPGSYNEGICERGFLGEERHDRHFGLSDGLYMPAAGDFFLTHRSNFDRLGGFHNVPSTTHLDSLLMCKASGAGLRQVVLLRPCVMFHQKHPVIDLHGREVSDACSGEDEEAGACKRRYILPGWELNDERCADAESEARHALSEPGGSMDPNWGFPDAVFEDVTLSHAPRENESH